MRLSWCATSERSLWREAGINKLGGSGFSHLFRSRGADVPSSLGGRHVHGLRAKGSTLGEFRACHKVVICLGHHHIHSKDGSDGSCKYYVDMMWQQHVCVAETNNRVPRHVLRLLLYFVAFGEFGGERWKLGLSSRFAPSAPRWRCVDTWRASYLEIGHFTTANKSQSWQ